MTYKLVGVERRIIRQKIRNDEDADWHHIKKNNGIYR